MNYLSSMEGLSCDYSDRKNRVETTKFICCEGDKKYMYIYIRAFMHMYRKNGYRVLKDSVNECELYVLHELRDFPPFHGS